MDDDSEAISSVYLQSEESDLVLDKEGILDLYAKCLVEDLKGEIKWKSVLNDPDIKIKTNAKGSLFSKDYPLVVCEMYLDCKTGDMAKDMRFLISAIHNPQVRSSWDKNIQQMELISPSNSSVYPVSESMIVQRQRNKS